MNEKERDEYIKFRMESAFQTFYAAKSLYEDKFYNSAINRLYYSIFYAVNALLVKNGIQPKTHSSVKSQFSLHFIKTNKLEKRFGQLFNTLHDLRQRGDYENIYNYDKESVTPFISKAEEMLKKIEKEILQS